MTSFADQITALAIPDTKTVTFEPPRLWWHNGVKQAKTGGSFYTRASEFPAGLTDPWTPEERFEGEQGFATLKLNIAVLAYRSQPFRKYQDAAGKDRVEYGLKWEKGMSIHTEVLCMIPGYDGAAVWSMKGMTGQAVTGKGGIIRSYVDGMLREAGRIAKRGLPLWSFWLPIGTKLLATDKIAYEDTGFGSFVTPPALHLPANAMDVLFVGSDLLNRGAELLNEHEGWADARRMPEGTVEAEYTVSETPQIAAPRNVPVAVDEGDTY